MIATFMLNLLCAIVPCDPQFRQPEISERVGLRIEKRFLSPVGDDHPIVLSSNGVIQGYTMLSAGGHKINAFEGIAYAEPPIGYYRFRSPEARKPWMGTWKATRTGPDCLQYSPVKMFRVIGNEDCLYLNIYSAKLPEEDVNPGLPVIVWIHGGSFFYGSGSEYGPSYLLDENIVLVSFNYRLGILGFMSLGDEHAPGNYGLKDQALAIKWVYDNIHKFGGDPTRITLLGHSAGAAAAHIHMISNKTRPYFQNVVSMSGTAFNRFAIKDVKKIRRYTEKTATYFRCKNSSIPLERQSKALVECLRRRDPVKLVDYQRKLWEWGPFPITLFTPVVESKDNPDAYLVQSPSEAYAKNDVAKVPWISTITEDEGLYPLLIAYGLLLIPALKANFSNLAPRILEFNYLDRENASFVTQQIMRYYFHRSGTSIYDVSFSKLSEPFSDRIFVNDFHEAILSHSKIAPTYSYIFRYKGKYNVANFMGIDTPDWGAGHAEDVFYVFNSSSLYHGFQKTDPERKLSQLMVNLFVNFAVHKKPLYNSEDGRQVNIWNSINPQKVEFLQLDRDIKMIPEPFQERIQFWKSLNLTE